HSRSLLFRLSRPSTRCALKMRGASPSGIAASVASSSRRCATRGSSRLRTCTARFSRRAISAGVSGGGRRVVPLTAGPTPRRASVQAEGGHIAGVNLLRMGVTLWTRAEYEREVRSGAYPRSQFGPQVGTPYAMRREPLLSPLGLPCTAPPWGALVSVDLRHNR